MDTVYFKTASGETAQSFDMLYYALDYEEEANEYTKLDWNLGKISHAKYKVYEIFFGYLTTTQLDWLAALKTMTAPQVSFDDSTYTDVLVRRLRNKPIGGSITVIYKTKES